MADAKATKIIVTSTKSVGVSLILTFLFGPLGMLYSSVIGGLFMMAIAFIAVLMTFGFGLLLVWPICMLWGALATVAYNRRLTAA